MPLTDPEKTLIVRFRNAGVGAIIIRRLLRQAGFVRGSNMIQAFIEECGYPPLRQQMRQDVDIHSCVFCDWRGPPSVYYAHWRANHRTRAGWSHAELIGERTRG